MEAEGDGGEMMDVGRAGGVVSSDGTVEVVG